MEASLDPQRSRVYEAEDEVFHGEMLELDLFELQEAADDIAAASWFRKRYKPRRMSVKDGRGGTTARAGRDAQSVHLKHGTRMLYILVHEMSHTVDTSGGEDHGAVFCGLYLYFVGNVYSPNKKRALASSFRKRGVAWDRRVARYGRP